MTSLTHDLANERPIDAIRERVDALAKTANDWANKVLEIADEEQARRADDFLSQLTRELQALTRQTRDEQQPHRAAIEQINLAYGSLRLVLESAKTLINGKALTWLQKKQRAEKAAKKLHEEEAARLAAEVQKAAAAAASGKGDVVGNMARGTELEAQMVAALHEAARPPTRAHMRGEYSTRARALVQTWHAEVTDVLLAFVHYQTHPDVKAVLEKLASAAARGGAREIPGCRVYYTESAR